MTDRLSDILYQAWLHDAGPAQATCANQLSALSQTTNPPRPADTLWRKGSDYLIYTAIKIMKRSARTAVATTRSALSP